MLKQSNFYQVLLKYPLLSYKMTFTFFLFLGLSFILFFQHQLLCQSLHHHPHRPQYYQEHYVYFLKLLCFYLILSLDFRRIIQGLLIFYHLLLIFFHPFFFFNFFLLLYYNFFCSSFNASSCCCALVTETPSIYILLMS